MCCLSLPPLKFHNKFYMFVLPYSSQNADPIHVSALALRQCTRGCYTSKSSANQRMCGEKEEGVRERYKTLPFARFDSSSYTYNAEQSLQNALHYHLWCVPPKTEILQQYVSSPGFAALYTWDPTNTNFVAKERMCGEKEDRGIKPSLRRSSVLLPTGHCLAVFLKGHPQVYMALLSPVLKNIAKNLCWFCRLSLPQFKNNM
jgi:hypothetical protein